MSVVTIDGCYRDRLVDASGRQISSSDWRHNIIVAPCRVLLAGFMRNDGALGIRALQVGRGDPVWDANGAPAPDPNTTRLVDPTPFSIPAANLTFEYLNDSDAVVVNATNRIQVTATLGPGQPAAATDPPYPLRECGLFGELNGQLQMIDYIRHPLIQKDGSVTLERKFRLVF
jgi:hypothetical protein